MTEYQPVPPCNPANLVHIAKGKEHKKYEYGTKASLVNTMKSNAIIDVCIHEKSLLLAALGFNLKKWMNHFSPLLLLLRIVCMM